MRARTSSFTELSKLNDHELTTLAEKLQQKLDQINQEIKEAKQAGFWDLLGPVTAATLTGGLIAGVVFLLPSVIPAVVLATIAVGGAVICYFTGMHIGAKVTEAIRKWTIESLEEAKKPINEMLENITSIRDTRKYDSNKHPQPNLMDLSPQEIIEIHTNFENSRSKTNAAIEKKSLLSRLFSIFAPTPQPTAEKTQEKKQLYSR